jgi:protein O-GlcNAc transferase
MKEQDAFIDQLLEQAANLEEQGSRLEAMQLLRRALEVRNDPVVLTRIGSLAIDLEQWSEAEDSLLAATKFESNFTPAYFYLGLVYRVQGRLEAAISCLDKASREEPTAANFTVLGVIQSEFGLTNEAISSFRRAISLDPAHQEAYYNLATILRPDDKEEAIGFLQRAIDIDPTYALAHRELGWLLRRIDRFPQAEYHLRRAIELDGSDGWAHIYLGNLMWTSGDLAGAENAFRKAIEVWPDRSVPYWSLAHFRELQGQSLDAENLYKKALEIDPGDAQANWRFGSYLKDLGDYPRARHYLRSALELDPNDERAKVALSELEGQN